ncbi:MAG: vitamin K epoxide reductase family protein [Phycisphaeraceae bacterium]
MTETPTPSTGPSVVSRSLVQHLKNSDVLCPSCGTNLRDLAASLCPECGCELDVASLKAAPGNATQIPIIAVRVLSAIAFLIAGYLALMAILDKQPAGCSGAGGCGTVLASRWSSLWGVPVSVPALLIYAGIFFASFRVRPSLPDAKRRDGWLLLLIFATFAGLGALWFIIIQAFVLKSFCPYCMIDHVCGMIIAGLVWYQVPLKRGERLSEKVRSPLVLSLSRAMQSAVAAVAVIVLFIACQIRYPAATHTVTEMPINKNTGPFTALNGDPKPPVHTTDGIEKDGSTKDATGKDGNAQPAPPDVDFAKYVVLNLPEAPNGAGVLMDRSAFPIKGDPKAKFLFVCLVDYTCPHCRELHATFPGTFARYGEQVAFMILPMPLNADCNRHVKTTYPQHAYACELARTALAVWKIDPAKFAAIDEWLFGDPFPRTAREARDKAVELVGAEALDKMIESGWPDEQIQKDVEVYGMAGKGRVPKLMFQTFAVEGSIKAEVLWRLLEEREDLGLRPLK